MHKKKPQPKPRKPRKGAETIMVICAHPDDEILGPGGTIARYSQEGKRVVAIIFSYGEMSHWWLKKKYTVEMRVKESKAAGAVVGIHDTMFLGLKDAEMKFEIQKEGKIEQLARLITKYSPSKIFTHSPDDVIFPDHAAVWSAVDLATDKCDYQGDVYCFNIWAKDVRVARNPKLIVDISKTFGLKWKALSCFKSQHMYIFQLYPGVLWRAIRSGFENKSRFAEAFVKMK